jgi:hypothetical protein
MIYFRIFQAKYINDSLSLIRDMKTCQNFEVFIYVYNLVYLYLFMFAILFTCIYLCLQSCLLVFIYVYNLGLVMAFNATFKQYFSYIVAVSFIGGGNWSARRKQTTCRKSQTNFIT